MPHGDSSQRNKITIEILFEASREIFSTADEIEACQKLTAWIQRFFPSCRISILLNDTGLRRAALLLVDGAPNNDLAEINLALKESSIQQVFQTGQVVLESDEHNSGFSSVIFPFQCKGQIIGVLSLASQPDQSQLDAQDVDLISFLADQTAASIEITRLYAAERERLTVEEKLIQAARTLSTNLKP